MNAIVTFIGCYLIVGSLYGLWDLFHSDVEFGPVDVIATMYLYITGWPAVIYFNTF